MAILNNNLAKDLYIISKEYSLILNLIKKCESSSYTINQAITDIRAIKFENDSVCLNSYINERISKNEIIDIIEMKNPRVSPKTYVYLNECQPTSIQVERSFSLLQNILDDNRNFKNENIRKYLFLYYNKIN